jgi:hypothetical protein
MVYFTAEWAVNGKRNLEVAIHTPKVRETVNKNRVISMIADLTQNPLSFQESLKKVWNTESLPLLAIYRPKQLEQPILLHDLFTESEVLKALEDAGGRPTSSKDAAPAGGGKGAGSSVGSVDSVLSPPVMTWSNPPGTKPDWLIRGENAMRARERVRRKLDESKELEFNNQPLSSVLTYLSDAYGFPIHGNAKSLEKAMVTLEEPITLNATGSLRSVLLRILDPLGLDYIVLEDGLEIRTGREAILHGAVRAYNLKHVASNNLEGLEIVSTIQKMVHPSEWAENGASCHLIGSVLLVKASEGMHDEIERLLSQLNAMRTDENNP